jgi:5-methylcytosine-specific restriction protein A
MLTHLLDAMAGKHPLMGAARSGRWAGVRKAHLDKSPTCALCGGTKKIEVHHIRPFHLHPELELDPSNLISLCEGSNFVNCHLLFGHLGSFKSFNVDVVKDAGAWAAKMASRPTGDGS